jgi:septal ring factor EnvC (AmiA/AmiB activator)
MTPEERLNRVERILGLFVEEGRRWRVRSREQDEKINMLIQAQMETSEQINRSSVNHEREMADLRRSQIATNEALRAFIKSLSKNRNGII